jgi:hypothetical protein
MRCAGHEGHMGRGEVRTRVWWGKHEGKKPLRRPVLKWKYIIKMDLKKWNAIFIRPTIGTGAGCFEHGSGSSDSMKCGEILN